VPGPGAPNRAGTAFAVRDGGEYVFTFWFRIEGLEWQPLGNENLLLRIVGEAGGAPTLGLQLWEWSDGEWFEPPLRGLWASGAAAGGDRFLTALGEAEWHRADLDFRASSSGDGRYLLLLDGTPVDERDGVSLIEAGSAGAEVGVGLFRDGRQVPGDSGITIADPTLFERVAAQPPAETTNP
jgi:hypothetical protein